MQNGCRPSVRTGCTRGVLRGRAYLETTRAAAIAARKASFERPVPASDGRTPSSWVISEIGIGAALLTPFVNKRLAGLALGAFSAGLLAMYFRNPTMTEADGIRPSQEGMSLAKDAFMAAIAGALVTDR